MTPTEIAINDLTTQTTELLASVNISKNSIDANIAAAVLISENKAILPLITVATNLITTQQLLITYIS